MMKKNFSFLILLFVFTISYSCYSQQEKETISNRDTVYRYQGIIPPVEFQYNFNEIFSKPLLSELPDEVLFEKNPSTIWLRTEFLLSNQPENNSGDEINTHFSSPLYQQYIKDSEFNMVSYILGTIQAGAVGYMAYRHIKKYGFWK